MWENPLLAAAPTEDAPDQEKAKIGVLRQNGKKIGVQQMQQPTPAEQSGWGNLASVMGGVFGAGLPAGPPPTPTAVPPPAPTTGWTNPAMTTSPVPEAAPAPTPSLGGELDKALINALTQKAPEMALRSGQTRMGDGRIYDRRMSGGDMTEGYLGPRDIQQQKDAQTVQSGGVPSYQRFVADMTQTMPGTLEHAGQMHNPMLMQAYQEAQKGDVAKSEVAMKDRAATLGTAGGLEQERLRSEGQKETERIRQSAEHSKVLAGLAAGQGTPGEKQALIDQYIAGMKYGEQTKQELTPQAVGVKNGEPAKVGIKTPKQALEEASARADTIPTDAQIKSVVMAGLPGAQLDPRGQITGGQGFNIENLLDTLAGSGNVKTSGLGDVVNHLKNIPQVGGTWNLRQALEKQIIASHRSLQGGRGGADVGTSGNYGGVAVSPTYNTILGEKYRSGWNVGKDSYHPAGLVEPGDWTPTTSEAGLRQHRNRAEAAGMLLRALKGE